MFTFEYSVSQVLMVGGALSLGCAVQGAVGFGAALFSVPLMIWAGVSLPSAITIALVGMAVQCGWNVYRYRDHVRLRELMPLFTLRILTLPLGIFLLTVLVGLGTVRIKQVVGAMMLITLVARWAFNVKPRERLARGWLVLAGVLSGVFAGMVGMGGPPVVMWVMAHDWPSKRSRSFLWATFLMLGPFNLALLCYKFPEQVWGAMLLGACLVPVVLISSDLGQRAGSLLNRHRLRAVTICLLLALSLVSILEPLLS